MPAAGYRCPQCDDRVREAARTETADFADRWQELELPHLELLLDNTRSVYNVGSIFRTADGAGVQRLHLCGITATPEHPKFAKTALGSRIQWQHYLNGVDAAAELKRAGFELWALEETATAENLFDLAPLPLDAKVVLILGNEVVGVDPGILALCDRTVVIPMVGEKRSLNVTIACGTAVYALLHGKFRTMKKNN